MRDEFFFTRVDVNVKPMRKRKAAYTVPAYVFVSFLQHPVDKKELFDVGEMSLFVPELEGRSQSSPKKADGILNQQEPAPRMFRGKMKSLACFNKSMEWNRAYFQRVRMFFYKRSKDVTFSLVEQALDAEDGELSELDAAPASSYTFKVHFKVQNKTEVEALKCDL